MIFRITGAVTLLLLMGSNGFAQQPQVMPLEDCLKLSCGQYDCSDACCSTGCKRIGRCGQPLGCGGAGCGCGQGGSCDACDAGRCTSCASDCSGSCGGGCAGDCAATTCCKKYFRTYFGWNAVQDYAGEVVVAPANLSGSFNEGWSLSFACGRYFQPGRRFELEFAYRNNSGDIWTSTAGPIVVPFDGQINSYSVMGNVLLDINRLSFGRLTPYVGGGIGVGFLEGDFNVGILDYTIDDAAFAYQLIAGTSLPINQRTSVFTEYRFLGNTEVNLSSAVFTDIFRYYSHNIVAGVQITR